MVDRARLSTKDIGIVVLKFMLYASNSFSDQSLPDFAERIKLAID